MRTHEHKGRIWTEVGREPYTRRDGRQSEVIRWTSPCCHEGCTAQVEILTGVKFDKSQGFAAKHCPAHKLTREEVNARFRAGLRARKQASRSVDDLV
jgi:hypothetical protein